MKNKLTKINHSSYAQDKATLKKHEAASIEYFEALARIKETQSYLEEFSCWSEFVEKEIGWSRQYVNRIIKSLHAPSGNKGSTKTIDSLANSNEIQHENHVSHTTDQHPNTLPCSVPANQPPDTRAYIPSIPHKTPPTTDPDRPSIQDEWNASKASLINAVHAWGQANPLPSIMDMPTVCKTLISMINDHLHYW